MANGIASRRREYLDRILKEYDESAAADEYDGKLWSLNHARLVMGRDVPKANSYFEKISLDPRPRKWVNGMDTPDWDFPATKFLRTLLDFRGSALLSDKAKQRLMRIFTEWVQPRVSWNKDNDKVARWPVIHTENHDLMCLTIGLFGEVFAGRDCRERVRQLAQSLSWRFERGWIEWNSPCYQVHYLNPLLILADHAPSDALRKGARDLANLQMAERALLSVNGYLGGPYFRGYERHVSNDRFDGYLPAMWIAFGLADPDLCLDEGVQFAASSFEPHPVVGALAADASSRAALEYSGARPFGPPVDWDDGKWTIRYFNTPHVSMGSKQAFGFSFQPRFFNVMFGSEPSKSLRTTLKEKVPGYNLVDERGEVAQHRNWLISRGTLVEEGGLKGNAIGPWRLYRVGKGLCAHVELPGSFHVFQTGDLAMYSDEGAFLNALTLPAREVDAVSGRTTFGEELVVNLRNMTIAVNGKIPDDGSGMLHDCEAMRSVYGSGVTEIMSSKGRLTLDNKALQQALEAQATT